MSAVLVAPPRGGDRTGRRGEDAAGPCRGRIVVGLLRRRLRLRRSGARWCSPPWSSPRSPTPAVSWNAPAPPASRRSIAALADRELLLVVDNCEHVQDAARMTIERLLRACPGVRVLATSRLRLMLPFERVVPVDGLSLAKDGGPSDAVTLFVDRMTAAGARAPTDEADVEVVRRICAGPRRDGPVDRTGGGAGTQPGARRVVVRAQLEPADPLRRQPRRRSPPVTSRGDRLELRPARQRCAADPAGGGGVRRSVRSRCRVRRGGPASDRRAARPGQSGGLELDLAAQWSTRPLRRPGDDPAVRLRPRRVRSKNSGTPRPARRMVPVGAGRPARRAPGR